MKEVDNSTIRDKSLYWWANLPNEQMHQLRDKYFPDSFLLTADERLHIFLSEHHEQAIFCPHCGAEKKVESGLCSICGKFPPMKKEADPLFTMGQILDAWEEWQIKEAIGYSKDSASYRRSKEVFIGCINRQK